MYFTKVELHNFGIYKGTHEMCLTDQIGNRNITLVGGLNGRGKTTFHDSILIALYGKQALKYIQEKARSYDKLLLDHINKHATDEETYVAVSLCLDDGTVLRVKRSWTARGKKVEQQTIVEKDGIVDKYLGESWSYYIEEILPFGIARFFFFNNEKITQLADDTSFEQIKSSIKSAIGVSTIEKAIEHTDEVIRRKKNALAAFEHSEENVGYQEIEKQIADIDIRLADATTQANELERKCEALTAKLEAKEKEFWSSGGDLSRNRDAIKLEMQKISSEVERVNEEILQIVESSEQHFAGGNAQNVGGQALFDSTNIKNDLAILIIPEAINRREELTNGVREEMAILGIFGIVDFQQRMYIAICSIYLLIQMPQNSRITPHIIASFHDATRFGIALNGSIKVVRNKVRVLGNIRELHKLNTLVQLIPLSEHATTYGISVLAYLTKGTSQSVARILHSGRCVLANNSIVMDGHFKAPIDIVPRGVNLGVLLLIIEQENNGYTHLFHSKQEAELHRRKLMYAMNNDAVKRQLLGCANRSFTTLYFLWCSSTFFDFLLGERNNNLL